MHLFQMPFSLCPVLFGKEASRMSEVEEILLSVELVDRYKVLVKNPGKNIDQILVGGFNWTDPVEYHLVLESPSTG